MEERIAREKHEAELAARAAFVKKQEEEAAAAAAQ